MRRGGTIVYAALSFVVGDIMGIIIGFPIFFFLLPAFIFAFIFLRKKTFIFLLLGFLFAGMFRSGIDGPFREDFGIFEIAASSKGNISGRIETLGNKGKYNRDEIAVLKALGIGDKTMLDRRLKKEYSASGAMHLLALSGLHIGIIYLLLGFLLSPLGFSPVRKIIKSCIILLVLWAFAFITGLGYSILRAVIMITVYEISGMIGANKNLLNALSISALTIVLLDRGAPFDIGFQLSFCSMLSIYFVFPKLNGLLKCHTSTVQFIWNTISLSVTCQIGTFPLTLLYFRSFPKFFMITNLMAIPLTTAIIYSLPIALLFESVPVVGSITENLLFFLLKLLNNIVETISLMT